MDPKLHTARLSSGMVPPLDTERVRDYEARLAFPERNEGWRLGTKSWDNHLKEKEAQEANRSLYKQEIVPVEMWWPWWDARHAAPKTERRRNPSGTLAGVHPGATSEVGSLTVREMHPSEVDYG